MLPEVLHLGLAIGNHLSDRLALHALVVEILHIELLLTHLDLLQLVFDGLSALQFSTEHTVTRILDVFAALMLALKGLVPTLALLLLTLCGLKLLL